MDQYLSCGGCGFLNDYLSVSFFLFNLLTFRDKSIIAAGYLLLFGGLAWFIRSYLLWNGGYLGRRRVRGRLLVYAIRWSTDYHDLLDCELERLMVLLLK